jgi:DNA-binding transcriptional MerR regulator
VVTVTLEPGAEPVGPDEPVYTIDELAALARIPVRTVRHYQSQKVLPPPVRQGRIALYRQEHLQRLRLIAVLQDRGLQLSAIRDALSRVEKGELWLEDWLGLSAELRIPWSEERPIYLSGQELAERLGHRPGLVSALLDAGLLRRAPHPAAAYLVRSPGLFDIALELEAAGVDIDLAAEAAATLRKQLRAAAGTLVAQALDRAGEGFARSGSTADVTKALGALRPLGIRAVNLIFAQEIERALRQAVDTGKATPPTRAKQDTQPEHPHPPNRDGKDRP